MWCLVGARKQPVWNLLFRQGQSMPTGQQCYKDMINACPVPVPNTPAPAPGPGQGPNPNQGPNQVNQGPGGWTDTSRRCGYSWDDANRSCGTVCWDRDNQCPNGMKCYKDLVNTCGVAGNSGFGSGPISGGQSGSGPVYGGGQGAVVQNTCNFGNWMCGSDGITLYQCGYVQGNVLSWRQHSQCQQGTRCVTGSFVGCN
ncbi:hypothetical protein BCR33DRAFT_130509 [Rhizoclosmatium globosum]|uniref:Uncharacterized protein n=1 Tax=Rhizoclosmatium globosum TaxID=329046 RepID=A0A1Y2CHL4_9FUNG|nr:hypothetical protein BCR33DRAFT_130509 [Rhizoclosmatium globosum]|eukprot:ORY46530.1 hypothetical protein BCR33DRAFT_130509 [Rhizoclosmatium globosum]